MICTRCGTQNSKTSKFCRECGKRLAIEGLSIEVEPIEEQNQVPDEAAVTELLYETLKLYERGRYESALAKCRAVLDMSPDSSSARSLLALIYEKKADLQIERGNKEDAEDYLRAAIRQIERVLETNKGSDADREKLEELCARLDNLDELPKSAPRFSFQRVIDTIKGLPTPWAAGAGTFMVVFIILAAISFRGGDRGKAPEKNPAPQQVSDGTQMPAPYGQPSAQAAPSSSAPVWAYDPEQSSSGTQQPSTPQSQANNQQVPAIPSAQPAQPSTLPAPVPPLTPYPVKQPQQSNQSKQSQSTKTSAPSQNNRKPSESARAAYIKGDYQSAARFYQQAIASGEDTAENHQKLGMCLYNLARRDEALVHFQRAVQLYMEQKANGIDVDGADRAIETCKLYIDDLTRR